MDILRYSPSFRALSSHTSQQIIIVLGKAWKSYFKEIKAYKKDPAKFLARPKPPKYKKKQFGLYLTKYQVSLKESILCFPENMDLLL
ncbi:MAG: hypothetical protein ACXAD7_20750 [Candidatus Kariarchaeaceae archaeon]|jgi:putative transposase